VRLGRGYLPPQLTRKSGGDCHMSRSVVKSGAWLKKILVHSVPEKPHSVNRI